MTNSTIRRQVERALGSPLRNIEWGALVGTGYVGEVDHGFADVDYLIDKVWQIRAEAREARKQDQPARLEPRSLRGRQAALSEIYAAKAAGQAGVRNVRAQLASQGHADGRLKAEDVPTWIGDQLGVEPEDWMGALGALGGTPVAERALLEYRDGNFTTQTPVKASGLLGDLVRCSESLAEGYGWTRADSTQFALANVIPPLPAISVNLPSSHLHGSATARITLTVDPMVSPQELARIYREVRRHATGGRLVRPQGRKALELARFLASRPDGEPWGERRQAWNKAHRSWRYGSDHRNNFHRDATAAIRRLLHPWAS